MSKAYTTEEMIHNLIRVGAKGGSISAKDVGMVATVQISRLRKEGRDDEANSLAESLKLSGYRQDVFRDGSREILPFEHPNRWDDEGQPIHSLGGLSYCSYFVFPRSILQSMPLWWQRQFARLYVQYGTACKGLEGPDYRIQPIKGSKFAKDPYADYDRGRRVVELAPIEQDL